MVKQNQFQREILSKIRIVANAVAKKEHYDYVLTKEIVLVGKPQDDLTMQVIRKYNQTYSAKLTSSTPKK